MVEFIIYLLFSTTIEDSPLTPDALYAPKEALSNLLSLKEAILFEV